MNAQSRDVDTCQYRQPIETDQRARAHCCRLLKVISRVQDDAFCIVENAACEVCCKSFPPSPESLNPVLASLLYRLSTQVADAGGVAGCDACRAMKLNKLAAENLPCESDLAGPSLPHAASDAVRPVDHIIPRPARRSGPNVRNWAVGVTTARREVPTLDECLHSLMSAGWKTPRLFVDGEVSIPSRFADLARTRHYPRVGAWPNYYLALVELLMRAPDADAYMIAQDDTLFFHHPGLKSYLESVLWPGSRPGIASLFCSRAYTRAQPGWYRFRGAWVWCALAFVFSRDAARKFVGDRTVIKHRWKRRTGGLANIDTVVGQWARRKRIPLYYPTPSLVQHIGHVSSLWQRNLRTFGNRRAVWFAGDTGVRTS